MLDVTYDVSRAPLILTKKEGELVWICPMDLFPEEKCDVHFLAVLSKSRIAKLYKRGLGVDHNKKPVLGKWGLHVFAFFGDSGFLGAAVTAAVMVSAPDANDLIAPRGAGGRPS